MINKNKMTIIIMQKIINLKNGLSNLALKYRYIAIIIINYVNR